jgi:hypothetical protein
MAQQVFGDMMSVISEILTQTAGTRTMKILQMKITGQYMEQGAKEFKKTMILMRSEKQGNADNRHLHIPVILSSGSIKLGYRLHSKQFYIIISNCQNILIVVILF